MIDNLLMVSTSSIILQSLGKIVQRAPAVGAKIWWLCVCLFLSRSESSRCTFEGIYSEQALCHGLRIDFHSVFTVFS